MKRFNRSIEIVCILLIAFLLGACQMVIPTAEENAPATQAPAVAVSPAVLVQGAPIKGSNGITFGQDGWLYIGSIGGDEIVVMDPETGEIIDRLGPDQGVDGPDDLTFGPDGSIYWTAILSGEVGRLTPDGVKTGQVVSQGVNPITFSEEGRLFVALDFLGDGLYELDPELVEPPRLIIETLGFLNAFDFGPDGFLYGPIVTQGKVVRINVDTAEMTTVAQDFAFPVAAKFDSAGRLYVGDQLKGEISRVDPLSGEKTVIATGLQGLDNLALDAQDRLFVSSATDGFIVEVLPEGEIRPVSPGGMMSTRDVAVLSSAEGVSLFVADQFTLREFDLQTGESLSLERNYLGVPGITSPQTVAADGAHLIVSSGFGNVVQVWDPATKTVLEAYQDFAGPANAIRFQGDLIVVEGRTGNIVRASATGHETLLEGLERPYGLAATADALWASDWASGTIWQLAANGASLTEPVPIATDLAGPEGLAVALDGRLLVLEGVAGRLSAIDLETGEVSIVAEGFAVDVAGETLNGIAVDPSGAVCVTDSIANALYRIDPLF